jgi:hypothetical protein
MKIEPLLVRYLLQNKSVSLQHIGHFELLNNEPILQNPSDDKIDLDGKVAFHYDAKANEDVGFIRFIMEHSKKIYPLAQSDLESYAVLAKQFLNLGKPVIFHGIGRLIKKQDETYVLLPAGTNPMLHDHTVIPADVTDHKEGLHAQKIDFSSPAKRGASQNKTLPLMILVGLMGIATAFIFYYNQKDITTTSAPNTDTNSINVVGSVLSDSTQLDSIPVHLLITGAYPNKLDAEKMKREFKDSTMMNKIEITTNDSLTYQLSFLVKRALSDTANFRDSLQRFTKIKWRWKN